MIQSKGPTCIPIGLYKCVRMHFVPALLSAVLEVTTDQLDNLFLPLFYYTLILYTIYRDLVEA